MGGEVDLGFITILNTLGIPKTIVTTPNTEINKFPKDPKVNDLYWLICQARPSSYPRRNSQTM
jgi:hypothetical protein